MKETGRTKGMPSAIESKDTRKKCEDAFFKGWGTLFTARELHINKNTVSAYFVEFREKMRQQMDEEFITRQKSAKELAIMSLDDEIKAIDDLINDKDHGLMIKTIEDPENPAWSAQVKSALEYRSNLKQQKHNLEMTPTIEVSVEQLLSEAQESASE